MSLLIKEIIIKNFRSHADSKIEFDTGINLIAGRNGAGKSSILEAILVSLYGPRPTGLKKEELFRDGTKGYSITLNFELAGKNFTLTRNGDGNSILRGDGITVEGDSQITGWIENKIIPAHVFTNAIYVRQGEIDGIVRDEESRERVIRKVTRIEDFENAWKNMGQLIREFERERDTYKSFVEQQEVYERHLAEKKEELVKKRVELEESLSLKEEAEKKVESLKAEYEKYEKLSKKISELRVKEKSVRGEVNKLEAEKNLLIQSVKRVEERIEDLKQKVERAKKLESLAKSYEELERFYTEASKNLKQLELEISKLGQEKANLERELEKIYEDEKKLENERRELDALKGEIEKLKEKAEGWEVVKLRIERKKEILSKFREKGYTVEKIKNLYEILQRAKEESRKIQDIAEKMSAKFSAYRTEAERVKEAMEKLKTAKGACPVCNRKLDERHREELLKKYRKELDKLRESMAKLEEKRQLLEKKREKINMAIDKSEQIVRFKHLLDELERIEDEIKDVNVEEMQRAYELYEELNGRLRKVEGIVSTLMQSVRAKESVESRLRKVEKHLNEKEGEMRAVFNRLRSKGFETLEELENKLSLLRENYLEWQRIRDAEEKLSLELKRLDEIRMQVNKAEEELRLREKELNLINEKMSELLQVFDEEEFQKVRDAYLAKSNELAAIKEKIKRLKETIDGIEKDLKELEKILKQFEDYKMKIEVIEDSILPELRKMRDKFRQYKNYLSESVFKEVETVASEIFEEFTEGKYSGIRLKQVTERGKERLKVFVIYQGSEKDIGFLSGGELIALGLAFRLALTIFMIKGRLPMLILDEPTPFLDEERRRKLVEITANYLRRIPQVIVVSHDDELKDAADRVIFVENVGGISKVTW